MGDICRSPYQGTIMVCFLVTPSPPKPFRKGFEQTQADNFPFKNVLKFATCCKMKQNGTQKVQERLVFRLLPLLLITEFTPKRQTSGKLKDHNPFATIFILLLLTACQFESSH